MTRVDLDAVEQHIEPFNGCPECKTREMVAELRVAREQLLHVRDLPMALHNNCADCDAIFGGFRP